MTKKTSGYDNTSFRGRLLKYLRDDPTRSIKVIAQGLKTYREKVYREKKRLEDEHAIWGYTAVLNESKFNHVTYLILMKMKPMSKELVELMIRRLRKGEPSKQNVRMLDALYLNGEYDWVFKFTAPNHATARRYFDSLRVAYEEYLLEKPTIVDVNFSFVREGKRNPEVEQLYDFVPV